MRKWILRFGLFTVALLVSAALYGARYLSKNAPIGTAYFAKTLCSGVFVSGRPEQDVLAVDLALDHPLASTLAVDVDRERRWVSASFQGYFERVAVFREGLGCTLAIDATPEELRSQAPEPGGDEPAVDLPADLPWPDGDSTTPTPKAPRGRYGAHFWLNAGDDEEGTNRRWPELPADAYFMNGFEGQTVAVVPSKKAVVVRLGLSRSPTAWNQTEFLAGVLAALDVTSGGSS